MKAKSANRYPPELRERAVRMLLGHRGEYCPVDILLVRILVKMNGYSGGT